MSVLFNLLWGFYLKFSWVWQYSEEKFFNFTGNSPGLSVSIFRLSVCSILFDEIFTFSSVSLICEFPSLFFTSFERWLQILDSSSLYRSWVFLPLCSINGCLKSFLFGARKLLILLLISDWDLQLLLAPLNKFLQEWLRDLFFSNNDPVSVVNLRVVLLPVSRLAH